MVRRELLFATPVIIDRLDAAAAVNAALEPVILAHRAADPGITRSNDGGWHSDLNLLNWARDPVTPVIRRIVELADAATEDLQARPGHRRGWSLEAWANINPAGAANAPHHHGGCYWSAVYYVRVDPDAAGALVLHDPRLPALDAHAPMLRLRDTGGEQAVETVPEAGMLILFPAWLTHSVRPHQGAGLRISIAVNLAANRSVQPL